MKNKIKSLKYMKKAAISILSLIALISSCSKDVKNTEQQQVINPNPKTMEEMVVPAGFSYKTADDVNFNIMLLANNDQPLTGVRVDIMDDSPENGGKVIAVGITNALGVLDMKYNIPIYLKQVVLNINYIGMVNNVIAPVTNGRVSMKIGGKNPLLVRTVVQKYMPKSLSLGKSFSRLSYKLGTYNNSGVPNYLMTPNDVVTNQFLADINATLPERQPVPTYHPSYLASNLQRNLKITALCDVWVTFVHEGAGYLNGLFYFKYPTATPPTNASQIDSLIAIFPNASYSGSGGGMATGNKVLIGRVGADTSIGFALAQNAWNGNTVNPNATFFYTLRDLNPETTSDRREHVAFLYDNPTQRFLIGFEDLLRNSGSGSDDDFNDCVVYATANPVTSVDKTNMLTTTPASGNDDDNDGVLNAYDDYPTDGNKAYNVSYPSPSTFANVAFEDLWPSKGDYDLNDVVVAYQYNGVLDASNKMVSMTGKFKLRAAGGIFKNAFSVELPINKSAVTTITGGLGLEANANKAIINVFANSKSIISNYNTWPHTTAQSTDTISIALTFSTHQSFSLSSFNPFIFIDESDKGRGYEVHLPDQTPSELVNTAILGTNADNSIPSTARYYKTSNSLPFAINIPETFNYPIEKAAIINAHLKFATWAQSGGAQYQDWYKNLSGYRNSANIY